MPLTSIAGTELSHDLTAECQWGGLDLISEISAEWRNLCEEGPCNQPFYRPEWIAAAVQAFAPTRKILLITVRLGNRLRAVLPLWQEKSYLCGIPFTRLRSTTNLDHSCRFDVIHGAGSNLREIARATWSCLKELSGWDAIELTNVPAGAVTEYLLGCAERERQHVAQFEHVRTPFMMLEGFKVDGDRTQFARSSRLRNNLRKGWRKLEEGGQVRFRRLDYADPEALEKFYRLEEAGWKGKRGTAIACSKQTREFYDRIACSASAFGYFSLYLLEVSESLVAADFGFCLGGRYFPLKIAYDENYRSCGPGHLLVSATLLDAVRRGVSCYDWLGHHEEWKARWTSETWVHNNCFIFRNNAVGHALHASTVVRHMARTATRRLARQIARRIGLPF